jgi:hypothetical protein
MKKMTLTLERRPVYARTQPEAGVTTTKEVEVVSETEERGRIVRVVRWSVSKSPAHPTGYVTARWSGQTVSNAKARYTVLEAK